MKIENKLEKKSIRYFVIWFLIYEKAYTWVTDNVSGMCVSGILDTWWGLAATPNLDHIFPAIQSVTTLNCLQVC